MKKDLPTALAAIFAVAFLVAYIQHTVNLPKTLIQEVQLCPRLKSFNYVLESDLPVFDKGQVLKIGDREIMCYVNYQKGYLTLTLQGGGVTVTLIGQTRQGKIHRADFYQKGPSIFYFCADGAKKSGENLVTVYHRDNSTIAVLGLLGITLLSIIGWGLGTFLVYN